MIANYNTPQDTKCIEIIAEYKRKLEEEAKSEDRSELLGVIEQNALISKTHLTRATETNLPNLVADAMVRYWQKFEYLCDLAVINGGFVRGDKIYPIGYQLTIGVLREELPFPKSSHLVKLKGQMLWNALEEMLTPLPLAAGCYPHLSHGWELKYDSSKPPGHRIISLAKQNIPIDLEKNYLVAITIFMHNGGDNCKSWTLGQLVSKPDEETIICDIVIRYLKELKQNNQPLIPRVEGRTMDLRK